VCCHVPPADALRKLKLPADVQRVLFKTDNSRR
jgi:hypothetical protein